jgi:D-lyxose ketol-isomerase
MKRSQINEAVKSAAAFFTENCWTLPPEPKWDVTDFGLGEFLQSGLVLVNLAEENEYCEKLMYAVKGQVTPPHTHKKKKEDIICRNGTLVVNIWKNDPWKTKSNDAIDIKVNGKWTTIESGQSIELGAGERVTIEQGIWHEFYPLSEQCVIGEVSTANDDLNDNFFSNPDVGRYAEVIEDEEKLVHLVSDN